MSVPPSPPVSGFAGLPLRTDADWKRTLAALEGLLAAVYRK